MLYLILCWLVLSGLIERFKNILVCMIQLEAVCSVELLTQGILQFYVAHKGYESNVLKIVRVKMSKSLYIIREKNKNSNHFVSISMFLRYIDQLVEVTIWQHHLTYSRLR